MRDHDLRASLAAIGQLQPGLEWEGELLDGRRRQAFCAELGIHFKVTVGGSLQESCSILWPTHPARALELARKSGCVRVLELAELCGTTAGAIALVQQATQPKKTARRQLADGVKDHSRVGHMIRRTITFEPELLLLAKAAAKARNKNLGQIVREGVWRVCRDLPGAPAQQPRRVQPQNAALRRRTG